jgi:predicted Zn finger-like uncharacterized protein
LIVTCESCKSRYKLDDAKITGRGAKITCPKCKAVFVVYAKDQTEVNRSNLAAPAAAERPASPPAESAVSVAKRLADMPTPARPADWDDEPTRVQGDHADAHEVKAPAAIVAPPSREISAPAPTPEAPSPPRDPAAAAARAASLDFRAVGVTTWKVKVKIGLVYDFSDIKTLRKYIQDGRVTATDVVSWDGKTWRAIGEIPDLDVFFVDTWEMLAARRDEAAGGATLAPAPPSPEVARAIEEVAAQKAAGEPSQFQDPFAEMRKRQQVKNELRRTGPIAMPARGDTKPAPAPTSRMPMVIGGLVIVLAGVLGTTWWMQQPGGAVAPPPPVAGTTAAPTPKAGSTQDIRDAINADLEATLRANPGDPTPLPATETPVGAPPDKGTVAGRDPDTLTPVRNGVPEGARPIDRGPRSSGGSSATTAPSMQVTDQSAADHESIGDDAAGSGDWAMAAQAYKKAVALDGRNAKLMSKLGRAQAEAGDGGAGATLQKAAQMGAKDAWKWLGDLAARQGDPGGAVGHYRQYLDTSPRDAAEIEKKISQLSGG